MANAENEKLLKEYIEKHENEECDCDEQADSMCWGMLYLGGSRSKEDIFSDWE